MASITGYRSLVGDMGTTLSGGQQQRVMLARALYRQPRILVLDEGTSALDIGTERRVNAALKGMGITRIIAAHRPETLASADRVVGLQEGRLVPVKFELRAVSAAEPAETTKAAKITIRMVLVSGAISLKAEQVSSLTVTGSDCLIDAGRGSARR